MLISVGLVILYKEKILLVRQRKDQNGMHLSIPKGGMKTGEGLLTTAIRETYEETGIKMTMDKIIPEPYLISQNNETFQRRIIYFVTRLEEKADTCPIDTDEISWAGFLPYNEAEQNLQITQQSVLMHLNPKRIPQKFMEWLCFKGIIRKEHHYEDHKLCIYDYTPLCKQYEFWNEVTLWSRGLIADLQGNILYRPKKKFFELHQLYKEFIPNGKEVFELYEKKDGVLGLLYWKDGFPFIATRNSFISKQAILGTSILYRKYAHAFSSLDKDLTYYFEIVSPDTRNIVNYGLCEDLFLIGAYHNLLNKEIHLSKLLHLPFPRVEHFPSHGNLKELLLYDRINEEGFVAVYANWRRIKIKFANYKKQYAEKYL